LENILIDAYFLQDVPLALRDCNADKRLVRAITLLLFKYSAILKPTSEKVILFIVFVSSLDCWEHPELCFGKMR
jgi:hypothetical protein